ncbi:flavin reductase family protein [Pelagibaculum spongiae]|uniref:Protein/domain typically associated with flavoprotein oxygenase, DIM6/NTAB family protein n=1 Tax=Pelagibaculum spongiae TaxID=2080658 RepID=A0A2V1GU53_9GAMM|nr:flavin reductase family protein [Pelagibaculum spongiae]PVZ66801.1 protein/domain typically associated with flavoprotein oxygenase, DIM6/NTAB family protein [Pelagibaculum spongiae]
MKLDFSTMTPQQAYFCITQSLIPRPIAWVLTENETGSYNLAPFSYFTAVSSNPPLLMISIGSKPDGSPKDTLANLQQRKKCVIHIADASQLDDLNQSAATLDYGVSEVEQQQLALAEMADFCLPRLANSKIAMAAELYRIDDIAGQSIVYCQLESIWLDDQISRIENDQLKIDASKVDPIARLGANEYALFGEIVQRKRP